MSLITLTFLKEFLKYFSISFASSFAKLLSFELEFKAKEYFEFKESLKEYIPGTDEKLLYGSAMYDEVMEGVKLILFFTGFTAELTLKV